MHVNDFFYVSREVVKIIDDGDLFKKYQNLSSTFKTAAQTPEKDHSNLIRKAMNEIEESQRVLSEVSFTKEQYKILASINKANLIGEEAVNNLHQQLTNQLGNYNKMHSMMTQLSKDIHELRKICELLRTNLEPFINKKTFYVEDDYDLITVKFDRDVSVNNLEKLQTQSKNWKIITQNLKSLGSFDDLEIVSYEDGSCKITIRGIRDCVIAIGGLVTFALTNYNTYLDIQIKEHELRKIRAEQDAEPQQEAPPTIKKEDLNELAEGITTLFLNERGITNKDEKYHEVFANIKKASMKLLRFIDDGGEVSFSKKAEEHDGIASVQNFFESVNSKKTIGNSLTKLLPYEDESD